MSRLKFAWARGARIQEYQNRHIVGIRVTPWWGTDSMPDWNSISALRIHPDDAHLEYGPLSTALRGFALGKNKANNPLLAAAYCAWLRLSDDKEMTLDAIETRMDYLFCAEFLADEGL